MDTLVQSKLAKTAAERLFEKVCVSHAKHQERCSETGLLSSTRSLLSSCQMRRIPNTQEQKIEQTTHISQTASDSAG